MKTTTKRLTPEEASRALYVDFEGRKGRVPVLLGTTHWASVERVHQYVTDPRYRPVGSGQGLEPLTFEDAVERILQRAEANDRLIVAWSTHELGLVERYAPEHLVRFRARFHNGLAIAKHWRNAHLAGDRPLYGSLANYLELVDYRVPEHAGRLRAAETIRRIDTSLGRDSSGRTVTAKQWSRWADLRAHNAHDCAGMRAVCVLAATELAPRAA